MNQLRRGRADTLLLISALLVTGLVAAGIAFVIVGKGASSPGILAADDSGKTGAVGAVSGDSRASKQDSSKKSAHSKPAVEASGTQSTKAGSTPSGNAPGGKPAQSSSPNGATGTTGISQGSSGMQTVATRGNPGATTPMAQRADQSAAGKDTQTATVRQQLRASADAAALAAKGNGVNIPNGNVPNGNVPNGNVPNGNGNRTPIPTASGFSPTLAGKTGTTTGTQEGGQASAAPLTGSDGTFTPGTTNPGANPGTPGNPGVPTDAGTGTYPPGTDPSNPPIGYHDPDPLPEPPVTPEPPVEPEPQIEVHGSAYLVLPPTATVGSTIQVPLIVDAQERYLAAYGLELAWDNTIISVDDVGPGGGAFDPPFVINLENDKGQLRFNGISIRPRASGRIPVATLTITIHAAPEGGRATIRPLSSNQTIAVYADDGTTPLSVPNAAFVTGILQIR